MNSDVQPKGLFLLRVFSMDVQGRDCGDKVSHWFTSFLGAEKALRLVHFEPHMKTRRPSEKEPLFPPSEVTNLCPVWVCCRFVMPWCYRPTSSAHMNVLVSPGGGIPRYRPSDAAVWGFCEGSQQQDGKGRHCGALPSEHCDKGLRTIRGGAFSLSL